ncbi:efflux RND transporter periplasmic adaptor subunit [Pontibacter akesuensis]|uniref:Membrane fusion protein, Cu(I)/Ag(I) efflux system n=1 Tax=Pontibacter akesuensis TaxID=388950 RepID=A0A1I7KFY0_9BACT|nr:efflux RND transporter periplasmic adaptor subunit [Pontibacter akesuensis]GHA79435.1 RND transporter [Pontibacter akesuensis]SFU96339.1 membrane fusion protein, Cu(I)/Ag(I) efflux system [Pontibacter akesuensis]
MKRYLNILLLLLLIVASACSEPAHEETAAAETTYTCPMHPQIVQNEPGTCPICHMDLVPVSQSGEKEGELMLSESQIALGNIKTMQVAYGDVNSNTILTGKLVLDETQTDVVSSRVAGRIERLYIKETGQPVQKGQPLYEMYSEELLTLQQEYLLALRQNQELGKENPRFASFLASAKQKLLLYGLNEAQIRRLASSGNLDARVTFVAPSSGVVTEVAAAEGQYIAEGAVLYRLGKLGKIWVEAELYAQELANVQAGDEVLVSVQGFPEGAVPAKVTFISPEYRQGSQVAILRAELPNRESQYLPGMQANVTLPGKNGTSLVIPTDAVIRDENGSHVWVQTDDHTFQARMVNLGEASADNVAILSGIGKGDKVVTSGAYLLYSEYVLKKGADPMAGHQH